MFYVSTAALPGYASNGSLLAYGNDLKNKSDFYPTLTKSFTEDGQLYCAPKDFSTLALFINTDDWKAAGLTDSDIPEDVDQLRASPRSSPRMVRVGLAMSPQWERLGAFMQQAGGGLTNSDQTKATVDSAANAKALNYAKGLLNDGSMKFSSDLGESWGGDAFGEEQDRDDRRRKLAHRCDGFELPEREVQGVELPEGPKGAGTLQFTNCWGIAKASKNQKAALLVRREDDSTDQQLTFAKEYGVMPSCSRRHPSGRSSTRSTPRSSMKRAAHEASRTSRGPRTSSPTSTQSSDR